MKPVPKLAKNMASPPLVFLIPVVCAAAVGRSPWKRALRKRWWIQWFATSAAFCTPHNRLKAWIIQNFSEDFFSRFSTPRECCYKTRLKISYSYIQSLASRWKMLEKRILKNTYPKNWGPKNSTIPKGSKRFTFFRFSPPCRDPLWVTLEGDQRWWEEFTKRHELVLLRAPEATSSDVWNHTMLKKHATLGIYLM